MKKILIIALVALTGCIGSDIPVAYATRAHPECTDFHAVNHSVNSGKDHLSLTEVSMKCGSTTKSIAVKCRFGWGLISDTICYENN